MFVFLYIFKKIRLANKGVLLLGIECKDSSPECPLWAYEGDCETNRIWMLPNCRMSCNQCGGRSYHSCSTRS